MIARNRRDAYTLLELLGFLGLVSVIMSMLASLLATVNQTHQNELAGITQLRSMNRLESQFRKDCNLATDVQGDTESLLLTGGKRSVRYESDGTVLIRKLERDGIFRETYRWEECGDITFSVAETANRQLVQLEMTPLGPVSSHILIKARTHATY